MKHIRERDKLDGADLHSNAVVDRRIELRFMASRMRLQKMTSEA